MQPLSQEFIEQCPVEGGFRLRGLDMTRIEVFVDAAFAFALTMLVISFDQIPRSYDEMMAAIKGIPAFLVAVAQLVWIWHEHNKWSRRYGLEDGTTVILSAALLCVVLIYIYPLRVMAQGMFSFFTSGFLPSGFELDSIDQLRGMFVFMGIGFATLCGMLFLFHAWARHRADELRLSSDERYDTRSIELMWLGFGATGLLSIILALSLPERATPYAGFAYAGMGFWGPWVYRRRERKRPGSEHIATRNA